MTQGYIPDTYKYIYIKKIHDLTKITIVNKPIKNEFEL